MEWPLMLRRRKSLQAELELLQAASTERARAIAEAMDRDRATGGQILARLTPLVSETAQRMAVLERLILKKTSSRELRRRIAASGDGWEQLALTREANRRASASVSTRPWDLAVAVLLVLVLVTFVTFVVTISP